MTSKSKAILPLDIAAISRTMDIPHLIYVMGIDGSGKTTVVEWLAHTLREQGYHVDVQWLRFNHLLSKPLLGFCRLFGLTRYEKVNGIHLGYHEFHRSRVISWLFVLFQYLDALRVKLTRVMPRLRHERSVVILDRFVYDIIIDLMVDTGIDNLDSTRIGRALIGLLPKGTVVLPLARDREALLQARPESRQDRNFSRRLQLYERLMAREQLQMLQNNSSLDELLVNVSSRVGLR